MYVFENIWRKNINGKCEAKIFVLYSFLLATLYIPPLSTGFTNLIKHLGLVPFT